MLRVRPPTFSLEQIRADHTLLRYLPSHGFSAVPRAAATTRGDSVVAVHHEGEIHPVELLTWIPHDSSLASLGPGDDWTILAEFIGRFHRASHGYPLEIRKPDWVGRLPVSIRQKYFYGPLQRATEHAARGDSVLRELAGSAARFLCDRLYLLPRLARTPRVVMHNDLTEDNVLFLAGMPVGLVDFDFCLSGPHIIDLVEGLNGAMIWDAAHQRYWGIGPAGDIRWRAGREFLRAYEKASGLKACRSLLIEMLAVKMVSLALYPGFAPGPPKAEKEVLRRAQLTAERLTEGPPG